VILAGDVGGTKTLLGLFERRPRRPGLVTHREYETNKFSSFTAILDAFVADTAAPRGIDAVAVGVAGPVVGDRASLTNVKWDISVGEIHTRFGTDRIRLLNDLAAMATSVGALSDDELMVLQDGVARPDGNAVVIAAGTGLGEAYLHRIDGHLTPVPSEGGHADFAARTDDELELVKMLREEYGRAEVEHVICGRGLLNLHRFAHRDGECPAPGILGAPLTPALVSHAALEGICAACVKALSMFVSAYGAEAGNLGLRGVATAGVFVGGGIAPKILPAILSGEFMEAFRAKGLMTDLVMAMPVKVILNPDAGLLGAAVAAQALASRDRETR
jgi:glucokinase